MRDVPPHPMAAGANVGILGLGVYLPPEIRGNDQWAPELLEQWRAERSRLPPPPPPEVLTEGARRVVEALRQQIHDPFRSTVERRVAPEGTSVTDMEEAAARTALAEAGVEPGEIDLLLTYSVAPDVLVANPACVLHHRLGLPRLCMSMQAEASSYSFMTQLTLADAMIRTGRARRALLVQSCISSRLLDLTHELSPNFGDAATAVVVGPVSAGRGLEASVSFTEGSNPKTLILSVPGATWYADGRAVLHEGDLQQAQRVFLGTADAFKESVDAVLARSAHAPSDIDFFCIHQGAPWLRRVVQDYVGLAHARYEDTYDRTAYVFASTLPIALACAQERGSLSEGDLVLLAAGGPGTTYGAIVLRWGT